MATMHVTVHSEKVADHLLEYAHTRALEVYVAPKEQGNVPDHVTFTHINNHRAGELIGYISANGWKTEIVVE